MGAGLRFEKAIVVGASSGIGAAIARQLADAGAVVAILGRREEELARLAAERPGKLLAFRHDVTDTDSVAPLLDRIVAELGGLDLLVYASGSMRKLEEGEYDFAKDREMVAVNLLGAMAWMNPVAARFEAAGRGTILGISSLAGERGRRGNPGYCTSKAGFTTYLESLRNRCSRYGVNVVTAKPGYVDTEMIRGMKGLFWVVSPEVAARLCLDLARRGDSASGYVPARWGLVMLVIRLLPSWILRRLNI